MTRDQHFLMHHVFDKQYIKFIAHVTHLVWRSSSYDFGQIQVIQPWLRISNIQILQYDVMTDHVIPQYDVMTDDYDEKRHSLSPVTRSGPDMVRYGNV